MITQADTALAQIATDLKQIDGTPPFENYVRAVDRDQLDPERLRGLPAIVVLKSDDAAERFPSSQRRICRMRLTLLVFAKPESSDSLPTQLNSLASDIKIAMLSDTYWNHSGTCIRTVYVGMEKLPAEGSGLIGMVMEFDVYYKGTWDSP